jgi:hypothetical protein
MGTRQAGIMAWLTNAIVSTSSSQRHFVEIFSAMVLQRKSFDATKMNKMNDG